MGKWYSTSNHLGQPRWLLSGREEQVEARLPVEEKVAGSIPVTLAYVGGS